MTRAITSPELVKLRSDNQLSRLFLAIHKPAVIFAARINQVFTSVDMVVSVTYDTVTTGAYTDILPGMTVWVGTSAGARDLGRARIRKTPTSTVLYIGETSEIDFADNMYLTVVDEFGLWAKHLRIDSSLNIYMDWDIAYASQHASFAPVPVMGPPAITWLTGASVTVSFDASASWCLTAGTITYAWTFPGADSYTGETTATPTATYSTAGTYRVSLAVTRGGITTTGYRYVYVYSAAAMPITQFALGNLSGNYESGGWEYDVTLYSEADIADVQDGAQVILFAKDYYNGVKESLGPISGRENIIALGWIDTEQMTINPTAGTVTFNVRGPQAWIDKMTGFPVGFENVAKAPTAWTEIQNLTIDQALFSMLYYRSTAMNVIDVTLTDDTRIAAELVAPQGSLWSQIVTMADETILARPCSDRYGALYVQINQQYLAAADRSGIPTVMTVTKQDWRESLDVEYSPIPKTARVEMSGIAMDRNTPSAYFSLANGHAPKRFGDVIIKDRLLLSDQTQANTLAGLLLSTNNLTWNFTIRAAANNRFVDIAPQQYVTLNVAAGDNPRGVVYSDPAIVRSVTANFMPESQALLWDWEAAQVSAEVTTTNGDIPYADSDGNFDFDFSLPPFVVPPLPVFAPPPVLGADAPRFVFLLTSVGLFYTETFNEVSPTWISLNAGFAPDDFTDGFRFLDVNQNGRYYVATTRQVFTGLAGSPASLMADEAYFLSFLGVTPPYFTAYQIMGLGCNPAADDEVAVMASLIYPSSFGLYFYGSSAGFPANSIMSFYPETQGSISWGVDGVILTYGTGISYNGRIVRMSKDGLDEDYIASLTGNYGDLFHGRTLGLDRILLFPSSALVNSDFYIDDGETLESTLTYPFYSGAFDETGQKIVGRVSTLAKKSIDGGANWTDVTLPLSNANQSQFYAMGGDAFVWALTGNPSIDSPGVFFTGDFFDTVVDKTGNLLDIAGTSFNTLVVKAFQ